MMLVRLFCALLLSTQVAQAAMPANNDSPIFFLTSGILTPKKGNGLRPESYENPAVNGVFLRATWSTIQPAPDRYDWTLFDAVLKKALAHRKHIAIGIIAAEGSPQWLADKGVSFGDFKMKRNTGCADVHMPLPWNETYTDAYLAMMAAVKEHLQSMGAYESLYSVKHSSISGETEELRIPTSSECDKSVDEAMAKAGYRPSLLVASYQKVLRGLSALYPEKIIGQAFLQNEPFPAIDDNGQPINKRQVTTSHQMIALCVRELGKRCSPQSEALNLIGMAPRVLEARQQGSTIGWQTNLYGGPGEGSGCGPKGDGVQCTEATYTQLLKRGVASGAAYIEVWQQDVTDFPNAFAAARQTPVTPAADLVIEDRKREPEKQHRRAK